MSTSPLGCPTWMLVQWEHWDLPPQHWTGPSTVGPQGAVYPFTQQWICSFQELWVMKSVALGLCVTHGLANLWLNVTFTHLNIIYG